MRASLLFICMLLFSVAAWAQRVEIEDRFHRHYSRLDLQEAIKRYQRMLEKEPENGEYLFKLANSYRLNSQYDEAVAWFEKASKFNNTPNCALYYAQMLLAFSKYQDAATWFHKYASLAETPSGIRNATVLAEYCEQLAKYGTPADVYDIEKMPFNSDKLDFSPAFLGDRNKIIFSSTRGDGPSKKSALVDGWTAEGFVDLYFVQRDEQGNWLAPELLPAPLNSKYHEGPLTFSEDYFRSYITRSDNNKGRGYDAEHNTRLHIYSLDRLGDYQLSEKKHWTNLQPLWFNNSEYSSAHPTLSKDGKTMVLSSDRPDSYGHMDLYVSFLEGDKWSEPKNLGDIINTSGTEAFPYLHPESNNLYFSSNLHVGLGGLDIFKALWNAETKTWEHPVNIGAPVNGPDDDFGIVVTEDLAAGFFTSNRDKPQEDDIYSFKRKAMVRIEGIVINGENNEIIPDASVTIFSDLEKKTVFMQLKADAKGEFSAEVPFNSDYLLTAEKDGFITNTEFTGTDLVFRYQFDGQAVVRTTIKLLPEACELFLAGRVLKQGFNTSVPFAEVVLLDKCTGQSTTVKSGEDGSYKFSVKKDCDYELSASKEGFIAGKSTVSTKGKSCQDGSISVDVIIDIEKIYEGLVIELEHIYFDFDKYFIRTDASQDLEEVYKLMVKYPEMRGEIGAHTDSRGSFAYNDKLSNNRAKSGVEWLIQKGIAKERLTWKGYGEYQLRNECSDGVVCSKVAHQRNRRVEFKVTYVGGTVESKERADYLPKDKTK